MRPLSLDNAAVAELIESLLRRGTDVRVRVTGPSMAPFLVGGEVVRLRPDDGTGWRPGDLVFYRDAAGLGVLHRLLRIHRRPGGEPAVLFTRGDGNRTGDDVIPETAVVGRVCMVERQRAGRRVVDDLDAPLQRLRSMLTVWRQRLRGRIYR